MRAGLAAAAVIRDAILPGHVRADLPPPFNRTAGNEPRAPFLVLIRRAHCSELCGQLLKRELSVSTLRAFTLAPRDDAGRQVRQAHRGIPLVYVLPARTRCAKEIGAEIAFPYFDSCFLRRN